MKLEEERCQENFISYVKNYYDLTLMNENKGIEKIHHDSNKQKTNQQKRSHEYYFSMTFSEHINDLTSGIV